MIVGLAHGCFDVLHFGHILHLRAARMLCDHLVVCLTPDEYVNKGPNRPIFTSAHRGIMMSAIRDVDDFFVGKGPDVALHALALVKPAIYFKGAEYRDGHPAFAEERAYCEANGIKVVFTQEDVYSTTLALERLKAATEPRYPNDMESSHSILNPNRD